MGLKLYYSFLSQPSNAVRMVLLALDIKHEIVNIDLLKGEQKRPEYQAINPAGRVPTLKDGEFCLSESRAIGTYLCNAYGKSSGLCLYPVDTKARAKVDQVLYASMKLDEELVAYVNFSDVVFGDATGPNEAKLPEVHKQLEICECYLNRRQFIAAYHLTVADFFMAVPLHLMSIAEFDDFGKYPKTVAWLQKIRDLPYFDVCNKEGTEKLSQMYKSKLQDQK